ncbi:MAG: cytochrome P450 [Actinobacteria bacterium]|nr:cytochrome P450 [Actinomycetota bacterium]
MRLRPPGPPTAEAVDLVPVDFCDPATFDDAWDTYAALRALDGLHRDEPNDLWVTARHEDVFAISRDPERYCSRFGVRPLIAGDMSIITLDGAEHVRQRRLINQGFTPRRVRELIPHVRQLTNEVIDQIAAKGTVDFVDEFAVHVPLIIICEILGLDPEQRLDMYRWSDAMMAGDGHVDPDDPVLHQAAAAFGEYATMCIELIASRRSDPADDLISILTTAFDAGDLAKDHKAVQGISAEDVQRMHEERDRETAQLNDDELLAFLTVLLVAGNETTRNALTGGLIALSQFPDQRQLLLDNLWDAEFMNRAADEIVRFVSPVLGFIRTVTEDHTYRNTDLREGDRILMLYAGANRDDRVFDQPDQLDLTRDPNPHLGFGIGPHFCLGANLARMEIVTVFQELFHRLPDITVPLDVDYSRAASSLVIGLQDIPADYSACPVQH